MTFLDIFTTKNLLQFIKKFVITIEIVNCMTDCIYLLENLFVENFYVTILPELRCNKKVC